MNGVSTCIPEIPNEELVRKLNILGYGKIKVVMDRGFYSAENINTLYKEHYNSDFELYAFTKTIAWDYEQKHPYKGDVIKDGLRAYLHLYFNPDKQADDGKLFVEFIALIYLSYIKHKIEKKGLFSKYTMHQLLDELDVIECFTEPGKSLIPDEVLMKQEQLYRELNVTPLLASPSRGQGLVW